MRKIRSVDITEEDTQQALHELDKWLIANKIKEKDVISVQRQELKNPVNMEPGNREGRIAIFVFYWSD